MALDELDAADDVAVYNDVTEAEVGKGFELALDFRGRRLRGRGVGDEDVGVVLPPAGEPIWSQRGRVHLADEKGVVTFVGQIIWPEIELVLGAAGSFVVDEWIGNDAGFGFGQIERDFGGEAVVFANDERDLAIARVTGEFREFLPAVDAAQHVEFFGQFPVQAPY